MNRKKIGTIAVILGFSLVIGACAFSIINTKMSEKNEDDEFKKISQSVSVSSTAETQAKVSQTENNSDTPATKVPEGTQQPSHSVLSRYAYAERS